ncbi:monocarboxylate transporter 12-like [Lineus longissimus]|uniref:monocarboxylate transporter 12-like n=1 Tax=Lineus longissimus TaxID=88925 RepID=UPI002B4EA9C2
MGKKQRHESGESGASADDETNLIPSPPDGGWGWVIVFSSLMCNIVVDGIAYSFGVFIIEFVDFFQESKGKTALIGSLLCGTYLCTGPIASALVNKFGCRAVTMVGSVIGAGAFFASTFSPNLDALIILYGVCGGFGFGLIYLPSIVSVGYYFERKRAVATGIAVAGSGVGTFIFAPFSKFLLDVYDWKNALWIMSGIILNCLVFGALMRPLEAKRPSKKPRQKTLIDRMKEKNRKRQESEVMEATAILDKLQEAKLARQRQLHEDSESEASIAMHSTRIDQDGDIDPRVIASISRQNSIAQRQMSLQSGDSENSPGSTLPRIVIENEEGDEVNAATELEPLNKEDNDVPKGKRMRTYSTPPATGNSLLPTNGQSNGYDHPRSMIKSEGNINQRQNAIMKFGSEVWSNMVRRKAPSQEIKKEDYAKPMYRRDIFYSGSIMNFHQFRSQPDVMSYVTSITAIPHDQPEEGTCSCVDVVCPCLPKTATDTLREMMDCSLFGNYAFLLICFGNVIGMAGFYVPFVYLADRAISLGIEPGQAALLLSIIGITNTLGRVLSGIIANIPPIKALQVNNVCLIISGIACIVSPFCTTYATLCIFAAVFGLCIASYISLTSIILCDMLGLEKLTNAFGLLTLARGISSGFGPPLAGIVYDTTGSYDASFYMGGGLIMGCALLHCLLWLPCFSKHMDYNTDAPLADKMSSSSSESEEENEPQSNTVV